MKSLIYFFSISISIMMLACTNQKNSDDNTDDTDEVHDKYSALVAIVSQKIDLYQLYNVNHKKKCSYQLEPGVYPIGCKEDDFWSIVIGHDGGYIKIKDCKVETWTADEGHGYVLPNCEWGSQNIPVRIKPDNNAEIIDSITFEKSIGEPCLGRENGWFKIEINKKTGYVNENEAEWCVHVFNGGTTR